MGEGRRGMKEKIYLIGKIIFIAIIHFAALAVIFKLWLPIANWYLSQIPPFGIDLFNSVSYLTYLAKHFSFMFNGWKYTGFSGMPWGQEYPVLYFYLMLPLTKFFSIPQVVKIFALAGNFLFVASSYLLFATLSKNRVLAVILALGVAYSVNVWRALVWAGGIPVFFTQAFFPLALFLIVKFIQTKNQRFLVLAALSSGLGFMGHPQSFVNFVFPAVFILLAFSVLPEDKFFSWRKIKSILLYTILTILVSFPEFYRLFFSALILRLANLFGVNLLGIEPPEAKAPGPAEIELAKMQFNLTFSDTNQALFYLLGVAAAFFVLGLIIRKTRITGILNTVSFLLVVFWVIFYIYLLSVGIDIYHGGWEAWYKLFWAAPVAIGALTAQFWGVFATGVIERFKGVKGKIISSFTLEITTGLVFFLLAASLFSTYTRGIFERLGDESSTYRNAYSLAVSARSSAFPSAVNVKTTAEEQEKLKVEIKPSFLQDTPGEYRLYDNDQTVNLWWNSLYSTPLARGYIDPPIGIAERWGLFWMDAAFGVGKEGKSSLEDDWKVPEAVVEKNIAFLLDWNAVKYLEGNHEGQSSLGGLSPILTSDKFVADEKEQAVSGKYFLGSQEYYLESQKKSNWDETLSQKLHFYKIKDELVSPIHQATNAPAVLVIGGKDAFDTVIRFFGMMGLDSRKIIVASGPKLVDDAPLAQMMDFDALVLYKYDYKNYSKSWERIAKYLENGGKVFIDTGPEVKESSSVDLPAKFPKILPEIFPVGQTKRGDLGTTWEGEIGDFGYFENVNLEEFSPLQFDKNPWNISYAANGKTDLREGASALLYSHGYPVLAEQEIGKGKIIWSGINLPYHVLYNYNFAEGKLLANVFSQLFEFGGPKVEQTLNWVSPEKRIISSQNAKGVLFKEEAFDGWSAKVSSQNGSSGLQIYKVGPTFPGFMYVRIPQKVQSNPFSVTFFYNGSPASWLTNMVSLATIILILDYLLFKNWLIGKRLGFFWRLFSKRTGSWWAKEEE